MNTRSIFPVLVLFTSLSSLATDAVFYSRGKRVTATEDSTKCVIISRKDNLDGFSAPAGVTVAKRMSSEYASMLVCEKTPSASVGALKRLISNSYPSSDVLPAYKGLNGSTLVPSGYLYIKLKSESDAGLLEKTASEKGCLLVRRDTYMPLWYTLYYPVGTGKNPVNMARELYETGKFAACQPEFAGGTSDISYDPDVDKQWGLYNSVDDRFDINASEAWNYATGIGVKVAIVDCGIDKEHVDLAENISSLSHDGGSYQDPSTLYGEGVMRSHGTLCAGVIGAVRNNGVMFAGVAPDCRLIAASVDIEDGPHPEYCLSDAILWASDAGADIINCSWTLYDLENDEYECHDYLMDAIDMAMEDGRNGRGTIIVTSSGNNGGAIGFPGNYRNDIITVGNFAPGGYVYYMSSHGPKIHVVAPGEETWSTMINDGSGKVGGTSMSAAFVSGTIALMLERNPNLTINQVREILARSATKINDPNCPQNTPKEFGLWNEYYGYGLINAAEAVKLTPVSSASE